MTSSAFSAAQFGPEGMARASTQPAVVRSNSPVMAPEVGGGKAMVGKAMVSKAPSFYEILISLCYAPSGASLTVTLICIFDVVLVFRVKYCRTSWLVEYQQISKQKNREIRAAYMLKVQLSSKGANTLV